MAGKVLNYFVCGHTARGFYNLIESALPDLERLFIVRSDSAAASSALIQAVGEEWVQKGFDIELLHNPFESSSLDGVILSDLKIGVIKEDLLGGADRLNCRLDIINLRGAGSSLSDEIEKKRNYAYAAFAEALAIHDEWETFFISNMDFSKANILTDELIHSFLGEKQQNKQAIVKHRFLGAATPQGSIDFVPNLTADIENRYFIKGRPGSGKSTLLKKLAKHAEDRGFDVEIYHCGFDPNSLDMVILRELGIAIFDSTAPHEYFPVKDTDRIIDMYGTVIAEGTDERYASEIQDVTIRYKEKVKEATGHLIEAKFLFDDFETHTSAVNLSLIDEIKAEISTEINKVYTNH